MAVIRYLKVRNFRAIRSLDWCIDGRVICLVGPGDSAKTTVLNAIELALLPRWNAPFMDSDFYQGNTKEELVIEVTVGEVPDVLTTQQKYGLYLRGYSAQERAIHDDPADDDEDVLTIRLSVDGGLEPQWAVVKDSIPEPRVIPWRDRELFDMAALGENVELNLTWSRGSALARLTDNMSSGRVISVANRKARQAVCEMELDEWQQIADKAKVMVRGYGVAADDLRPGLDARAIRFGQSVLSLYDGPIPLHSFGLGSRRLAALAVQEAGIGKSSIVLVDEVEHGLEPHRIRKLLKILCDDRKKGQIIMTSHSPTAVLARSADELRFTRLESGHVDVLNCSKEAEDALQSVLRKCPVAVFARSVVVCEGKTEEGLCTSLNQAWTRSHGGEGFELMGVVAVCGEGDEAPKVACQFAKLGYRTVLFGDSDKLPASTKVATEAAGAELLLWDGNMATEQRIATDAPLSTLQELLNVASETKSKESCIDSCKAELAKLGGDTAVATGIDINEWLRKGADERTLRTTIGNAAKSSKWFKNLNDGERLGNLVAAALPDIAGTPLGAKLKALENWVYAQ